MKEQISPLLIEAVDALVRKKIIPPDTDVTVNVERCRDTSHGDFSTNLAMTLAKACKKSPRQVAEDLIQCLPEHPLLEKVEIAGPGFINFFIKIASLNSIIETVLTKTTHFGQSHIGKNQKTLVEFVSANPTGPLHVGHGRSAAIGASLTNILSFAGFDVDREYYVNDAGRQMDILAVSVWLRYLALLGETIGFPANAYQGQYVISIAQGCYEAIDNQYHAAWPTIKAHLPADEADGGDKEIYIDALIKTAKERLDEAGFAYFHQAALNAVLTDIKDDLSELGLDYQSWFSEKSLMDAGKIAACIQIFKDKNLTYEKDGALWFKATEYQDEKDRVLKRANGQYTYFASDAAYHWDKYERGYERIIDMFGADHHGYVSRIRAAVTALGHSNDSLDIMLVQFAILFRGDQRVQMSTRSGSFVTLRQLRQEVGLDATRFFYVMRKAEQHMDFDLELAKSRSNDNPVYYIQYAHARICSVFVQLEKRGHDINTSLGLSHLDLLDTAHEQTLVQVIARFPEVIERSATYCEPHLIAYYLKELSTALHSYYNAIILLCDDASLRNARMCLLIAVKQCIANGLSLLGVSAPESM